MRKILIIAFTLLFVIHNSNAQLMRTDDSQNRMISLGMNSDAFAGMELGYAQNPGILQEKDFRLYLRFSFPLLLAAKDKSLDSWEIKAGIQSDLFRKGNWGAIGDAQLFLIHHNQILGNFMPLGLNIRLTPCYHFSKGYLGFQINWNQIIATHISHSQYVKETFENLTIFDKSLLDIHPRDGWYGDTGSHFSFGVEGGWDLNERISLYGDLGIIKFSSSYTGLFDAMMMGQAPFYGNMRLYYKL